MADLAAYPIARFVETDDGDRMDWKSILPRIRKGPFGKIDGYGLKIFPDTPIKLEGSKLVF